MPDSKRVFVAYTGGTIGMRSTDRGWAPEAGFLEELMHSTPVFSDERVPRYDVVEFSPLLDSASMSPPDWVRIAGSIEDRYQDYDGFVVLHGTDTMAYTASALAFMLDGLDKPVILTGSQIPLCEARNDAQDNLVTSLLLAGHFSIPEVCLYFHGKLLRGCRSVKVDSEGFAAFDSPNLRPLGAAGTEIDIDWRLVREPGTDGLTVHKTLDTALGVLWLFPGITGTIVRNFLEPPLKGAVLQAFGVGNGPAGDADFLAALREAHDRGVVLVDCTQCLRGGVNLGDYATGVAMAGAGAVSGGDMTLEAALTKLQFLFGQDHTPAEVEALVQQDLRGELTRDPSDQPGELVVE